MEHASGSSRSASGPPFISTISSSSTTPRWENYWDRKLPIVARGPIQLQTHDHELHWRNIAVREIPPDEANQILAKHGAEGFRSIFNGQNLAELGRADRELRGRRTAS